MTHDLRVLIAQRNATVGDLNGNLALALDVLTQHSDDSDLIVFPESFLIGYQADDLVLNSGFLHAARQTLDNLAQAVTDVGGPSVLIGTVIEGDTLPYNAAILLRPDGRRRIATKVDLPNTGPFDELRTFAQGQLRDPFEVNGFRVGVAICEEAWHRPVIERLAAENADLLVVLNGSPYTTRKHIEQRIPIMQRRVKETGLPLVYVNLVGGQDELVYDGASFVLDAKGDLAAQCAAFEAADTLITFHRSAGAANTPKVSGNITHYPEPDVADYQACVLGLRDYVNKNEFPGVILGISGGLDSALSAAIAVDALGKDRVLGLTMPSKITSGDSLNDAKDVAKHLDIRLKEIEIGKPTQQIFDLLTPEVDGDLSRITKENVQPRIRMTLLMGMSNQIGYLPLACSNKSELSVGYSTINGDMAGGFNPIKGLWKTDVIRLSKLRNSYSMRGNFGHRKNPVMPAHIITKPPTAELSEGQTDEAALGPYPILDEILKLIVNAGLSVAETYRLLQKNLRTTIEANSSPDDVKYLESDHIAAIARLVQRAEFKRRQAAPGTKIDDRAFGRDRRYPITNQYGR